MRGLGAGLGLLGLLITTAIILFLLAGRGCSPNGQSYLGTLATTNKEKKAEVNRFGGNDPQGQRFRESLAFAPHPDTGAMRGLSVQSVDPTGVAASTYGLLPGDVIEQIGPHEVGGYIVADEASAADFLDDAFARTYPLTVRRGDEVMELKWTAPPTAPPPGTGNAGGGTPSSLVPPALRLPQ